MSESQSYDEAVAFLNGEGVDRLLDDVAKLARRIEGEDIEVMERSNALGLQVGEQMEMEFVTLDSGAREEYKSGMVRDTAAGKPRYDLIPIMPLRRLADLYARGAEKYGDRNWQLASSEQELQRFKASGLRHYFQYLNGDTDEDHAAAVVFNVFAQMFLEAKLAT